MTMAEMNTADQIRAERIARAGAAKMTAAGYTFHPVRGTGFLPAAARKVLYVVKPDGDRYTVNTHRKTWNCKFREENPTCKHIIWASEQAEWEASVEAREAQWQPTDQTA